MPALIQTKKKEATVRFNASFPEPLMRTLDAYRLFLQAEGGHLPTRAEVVEQVLFYMFGKADKAFLKWYKPADKAQATAIDALQLAGEKGDDKPAAEPVALQTLQTLQPAPFFQKSQS